MPSEADQGDSRYDVVVIGAGPAGEAAAMLAGNLGYAVALVERDTVGGTVVTSGGAPTKAFREAALYPSSFEENIYGVALAAPPEVMYPAVLARAREVSKRLVQATLQRIRASGVHLVHGTARLEADHMVVARAEDGSETWLRAERVVIATGSSPLRPPSVPFDDPCVFDSETIIKIARKPRELLIVGGGAIGVEDAGRRTSCPWVFAAGDVIGPWLASVAIDQGRQAVCGAFGLDFSAHVDQIPAAAVYGRPEVARAGKSEEDCRADGIPYVSGRCELGTTPRGVIAGQDGLLKLVFHRGSGVLLGVHVICEIASQIAGTGQAMIHNEATVEDVIRMAYNTPTYTYGYKLAAADTLSRLHPDVLRGMNLPSQADRLTPGGKEPE